MPRSALRHPAYFKYLAIRVKTDQVIKLSYLTDSTNRTLPYYMEGPICLSLRLMNNRVVWLWPIRRADAITDQ